MTAYNFAVKLDGAWIPRADLLGPFEVDESIDTVAVLFSFALVGRRWSIHLTASTWTATPVEVWVTEGPIDALTTSRRAFGYVLACEQLEGIEPTLRIKCGDPSRLQDRYELCYEFAPDEALRAREGIADGARIGRNGVARGCRPDRWRARIDLGWSRKSDRHPAQPQDSKGLASNYRSFAASVLPHAAVAQLAPRESVLIRLWAIANHRRIARAL